MVMLKVVIVFGFRCMLILVMMGRFCIGMVMMCSWLMLKLMVSVGV